ncbi:sensor histidine kinase [Thermocrinis jamiesonii]|jgi:Signal transduction histidine kinase involved in nitrogen fixation and metabolism regulation|uniref:sensor histidine kinase n=1 Tax=Thermocrinis jamiesonii TaxID=1302351 RepID=UPI001E29804E|nr:HAMP domain-containing protein [Thermocrinis jamiesonii]
MGRIRLFILFLVFLAFFIGINIAFLDNLRKIWTVGFPLILLVINLDLLVLILAFFLFLRKFIKTYLQAQKGKLRKRLSSMLFLYMFLPVLFLNLASSVVLLQSTKTFVSSQLKDVVKKTENLKESIENQERERVEIYRAFFSSVLKRGESLEDYLRNLKQVKSVSKVEGCVEQETADFFVLCVAEYRIEVFKDRALRESINSLYEVSRDLRSLVKSRDIIGGIYLYFLVLLSFVALIASFWFGNLVARYISIPLEELSSKAKEIAKGNFDVSLKVYSTGDEISQLAQSFSSMKDELKAFYQRLEKEKEFFKALVENLPVGIKFISKEGEVLENRAYHQIDTEDPQIKHTKLETSYGIIHIYEDLRPVVMAERFKTWQDAVKRLAHEIKNPLTPIKLNLERLQSLAQKGKLTQEEVIRVCQMLLEEIERIKSAVNYFRDISYSREIKIESFDLGDLIREMGKLYPTLNLEVVGNSVVRADKSMIKECFFNLFNNSLEWGAKSVRIFLTEKGFTYEDDGKGLKKGEEESIFLPYRSSNPQGMGLGLSVVKHIFQMHGWEIKVIPREKGFYAQVLFKQGG